jgi:outer membrane scaffolding protein for murein synthesis (MipA/OmpV family)
MAIDAVYAQEDIPTEAYDAVLVEAAWSTLWRVSQHIRFSTQIGASWMNDAYAEAFYSVRYPTQQLDVFTAESGIKDIDSSVAAIYMLNRNIGLRVFAGGSYLLNDAADSPLTQSTFQPFGGAFILYNF